MRRTRAAFRRGSHPAAAGRSAVGIGRKSRARGTILKRMSGAFRALTGTNIGDENRYVKKKSKN